MVGRRYAEGASDRDIAAELGRSYYSVALFRKRLVGKRRLPGLPPEVLIDECDEERVAPYRWWRTSHNYYKAVVDGVETYLHRFIMQPPPDMQVDHVCGKADHRRSNLRVVTQFENMQNRQGPDAQNKSGHRGVHWSSEKRKWCASHKLYRRVHFIGYFDDILEAAEAARKWRAERMPFATN